MFNVDSDFLKSVSVLYVEDDIDIAEEIEFLLSNYFPNLTIAYNGQEGLEKFKEHSFDIVLTDIQMPLMDGITMSKHIKEISPETPIIISSAFSDSKYLLQAIDIGVTDYIIKPVTSDKIFQAFNKVLENLYNKVELQRKYKELEIAKNEAIEAEKAKDAFLSNMSHEIRTPLNAIIGFITLLQESKLSFKEQDYLNIIQNSSHSLLSIINDILDFAKIRSGNFSIDPYEVDIANEISNVTELFSSKVFEKNINFLTYIDPKIPSLVKIDAVRVKQILSNYLSNAVKFTPDNGSVELNITYDSTSKSIRAYVKDSGIGIRKENLSKIFNPFSQEDDSTARNFGGTGLGLSISKKLAELMGGDVWLESIEKEGSTFGVFIPVEILKASTHQYSTDKEVSILLDNYFKIQKDLLVKYLTNMNIKYTILEYYKSDTNYKELFTSKNLVKKFNITSNKENNITILDTKFDNETNNSVYKQLILPMNAFKIEKILNPQEVETDAVNSKKQFSGNILLAEDSPINQKLMLIILDSYGLSCDIANDGEEAVELYKQKDYDLVLMDCQMPKKDGIEATLDIYEYDTIEGKVPNAIVALSANVMSEDKDKFFKAGIKEYLTKPIDNQKLEEILEKYLEYSNDIPNKKEQLQVNTKSKVEISIDDICKTTGLPKENIIALIGIYFKSTEEYFSKLQKAIDEKNYKEIEIQAHTIVGASSIFNLKTLCEIAREIENAAKSGKENFDYDQKYKDVKEIFSSLKKKY